MVDGVVDSGVFETFVVDDSTDRGMLFSSAVLAESAFFNPSCATCLEFLLGLSFEARNDGTEPMLCQLLFRMKDEEQDDCGIKSLKQHWSDVENLRILSSV